jgi:hypothetical protein
VYSDFTDGGHSIPVADVVSNMASRALSNAISLLLAMTASLLVGSAEDGVIIPDESFFVSLRNVRTSMCGARVSKSIRVVYELCLGGRYWL